MNIKKPHTSVLIGKIIEIFNKNNIKDGTIIDATFGSGGYTRAILHNFPDVRIVGVDRDENVRIYADEIKKEFGNRFEFLNDRFSNI